MKLILSLLLLVFLILRFGYGMRVRQFILQGVGGGQIPPAVIPPPPIGTALIQFSAADPSPARITTPSTLVTTQGSSITITYTIKGASSAWLDHREDGTRIPLIADGTQQTYTFTPTISGDFPIFAQDSAGGVVFQRLPFFIQPSPSLPSVNPGAVATVLSVASGNWASASTWSTAAVPGRDDSVKVQSGHTVTVNGRVDGNGVPLQCGRVIVQGNLTITNSVNASARLLATDVDVNVSTGTLTIDNTVGTAGVAMLMLRNRPQHTNDNVANSPDGIANFWRCLAVRNGGNLIMKGKQLEPYARLAAPAHAGDTSIVLSSAVNWPVGMPFFIPDSRDKVFSGLGNCQLEDCIVRGVSPDGKTVYLLNPLVYDHLGCLDLDGNPVTRPFDQFGAANPTLLLPHAFTTAFQALILTEDATDTGGNRPWVYLNGAGRVDCRWAGFHGTGSYANSTGGTTDANLLANNFRRIPVLTANLYGPAGGMGYDSSTDTAEFQPGNPANTMGLNGPSARFYNCSFYHPFIHGFFGTTPDFMYGISHILTYFHLYRECVAFNFYGTLWGTLDVHSTMNVFQGNFNCRCNGNGKRVIDTTVALATNGLGWGLASSYNWFRNNISANTGLEAGATQYNFSMYGIGPGTVRVPNSQGVDMTNAANYTTVSIYTRPVLQWTDNESYSGSRHTEFWFIGTGYTDSNPNSVEGTQQSFLTRQTCWNSDGNACFIYPITLTTFDTWFCRTQGASENCFWPSDYLINESTILNADVEGFFSGVSYSVNTGTAHSGSNLALGATARMCVAGGRFRPQKVGSTQGSCLGVKRGSLGDQPGSQYITPQLYIAGQKLDGTAAPITFLAAPGITQPVAVQFYDSPSPPSDCNLVVLAQTFLYNYAGHNWQLYHANQSPSYVLPQNVQANNFWGGVGATDTNQTDHDTYLPYDSANPLGVAKPGGPNSASAGRCFLGELTPAAATTQPWLVHGSARTI